jgi:hypothetical protein
MKKKQIIVTKADLNHLINSLSFLMSQITFPNPVPKQWIKTAQILKKFKKELNVK